MKRFQSILCASLLTLAIGSTALAGNIQAGEASTGVVLGDVANTGNISTEQEVGRFSVDLTDYFLLFW